MIKAFDKVLEKLASWILISSLAGMLLFTLTNIVARWFNETFIWIDPLVRHLVFISAFMGGVLASGNKSHIKIDLASRALEASGKKKAQKILSVVLAFVSAIACFYLAKAGMDFARIEMEFGRASFLGLHSGWLVSIIPFGFGFIGLRFLTSAFNFPQEEI